MQRQLRAYEGGDYRAEEYLRPDTVAKIIAAALRLPDDGELADLRLVPRR